MIRLSTGWQDRAGIARHVRDARALAMPSRLPEPFGLAAAEASLSGLPVILPDIALLSTGLEEAGIGLAYPSARADGLEQALSRIVAMPAAELREMSLRAHSAKAGIAQSPEHWVDTLLSLYARLPAQKRAVA